MRLLIKFIISLCFLLWGGYAHAYQRRMCNAPKRFFETTIRANLPGEQHDQVLVSKPRPSNAGNKAGDTIIATEIEEEDDEAGSYKKRSLAGHGCISFFDGQAPGNIPLYLNAPLPFCEHFSYSSSDKFILHRVIRI